MPTLESRLRAAVWGQFIGDAAALGAHWIYDLDELATRFPSGIQGFEEPHAGHYHAGKQSGDQTHYGDAALLLLESLAACGSEFRERDFEMRIASYFGSEVCKSYVDSTTRRMLEDSRKSPKQFQVSAQDDQPATISRLAPLVVAYHQRPTEELLSAVRQLTLVVQSHPLALGCASAHAVLLGHLLNGSDFPEAFEMTRKSPHVSCDGSDYFEFAHMLRGLDVITATGRFGQSCGLSQSFPSALHAGLLHHQDFTKGILQTVRAGGDCAARAAMLGAWMGAIHGMEGIPKEWLDRLRCKSRITLSLNQVLKTQSTLANF